MEILKKNSLEIKKGAIEIDLGPITQKQIKSIFLKQKYNPNTLRKGF